MLEVLKMLLDIEDDEMDLKLDWILKTTTERLKTLLGGLEPPKSMEHIIVEVSIIRFNRIGSEGLTSHTIAGEIQNFTNDDFGGYYEEINAWLNTQTDSKKRRVRFL